VTSKMIRIARLCQVVQPVFWSVHGDVTGPCATLKYGAIMLTCGSRKTEFRHDGKQIGWNAELRAFSSVIGKPKPNHLTVFRRLLVSNIS